MTSFPRVFLIISTFFCFLVGDVALAEEWNVGFRIIQVSDPVIHNDIEVAVWYPTRARAKEETVGAVTLQVAKNAEPNNSSNGLILISHGFAGNFLGHNDTAQFLAKLGYVVATPTHPDLPGLATGKPEIDPLVIRPRDIQLIIDELLDHPLFKASVTQKQIGIIGFSLGAYTALISVGATPDLSGLEAYCTAKPKDTLLCSVEARPRFGAIAPLLVSRRDARISGAVLLAPAYGPFFSEKSFSDVTTPVQIFSAEKDEELDNQYHAQHFEKLLSTTATLKVVPNAGHYVFMAPCPERLRLAVPAICEDSEFVDRAALHQELNRDMARFFDKVLE